MKNNSIGKPYSINDKEFEAITYDIYKAKQLKSTKLSRTSLFKT